MKFEHWVFETTELLFLKCDNSMFLYFKSPYLLEIHIKILMDRKTCLVPASLLSGLQRRPWVGIKQDWSGADHCLN